MADKFKKIDKEYLLSDSSVNCYGFRLCTSGYQLADYSKNPIGFYMHKRDAGVVLRWEDIRIDGDNVYGKPVINLSNARGQQTVDEAEAGFLNAASMGEFVVLEYSIDPEQMLAGQTGPTITKWYNRECSLVDIPGNSNALCKLFDTEGNEMSLADLTSPNLSKGEEKKEKINTENMKQITLTITAALYASLGLAATATAADIEGKLPNLIARANAADQLEIDNLALTTERDGLKTKLVNLTASTVKKEVEGLLANALEDKKITVELSAQFAKDYATNPDGLKVVLQGLGAYTSVADALRKEVKVPAKYEGKTWDELHEANMLPELKAKHYDLYKQLWEAEHGQEYKA